MDAGEGAEEKGVAARTAFEDAVGVVGVKAFYESEGVGKGFLAAIEDVIYMDYIFNQLMCVGRGAWIKGSRADL